MTINVIRRAALIALASCAAFPGYAEPGKAQSGEFVTLDKPAVFEMHPNTGSLKESVQKGQQLVWHPNAKPNEGRLPITHISVAFLREQSCGQANERFSGNV